MRDVFWSATAFVATIITLAPLPIDAFSAHRVVPANYKKRFVESALRATRDSRLDSIGDDVKDIQSMSVRELKRELATYAVSTLDVFEKNELVQRLHQARQWRKDSIPAPKHGSDIHEPLYLTFMDQSIQVAAVYGQTKGDEKITISPTNQPFPSVKVFVRHEQKDFSLSLLLDTACTGFVLRPEVVERYCLPKLSTPVTMTGAGGTGAATGLTQLECFSLSNKPEARKFGPLPAVVQNIGALPRSLDGIIGLSFLNQFDTVEMDFAQGQLALFNEPPPPHNDLVVVAEANLNMVSALGIYTVPVMLGDRGPVNMLVDTGAASSFLSWKGVEQLALSQASPVVQPITGNMGAMGSDNVAIQLTHRIHVSSSFNLGLISSNQGLPMSRRLAIDIGTIPILENLQHYGVGGILGIDALMQCSVVRVSFRGPHCRLTLLSSKA